MTATPFGASEVDTAEYMLGDVYVNVVAFESDGSRDANLEDWNDAYRNALKAKIQDGLKWWEDTLDISFPNNQHDLNFQVDFNYLDHPIQTGYEPISRPSYDFQLWTADFFDQVGFNGSDYSGNSYAFNQAQREAHGTDWAFTIFVVNDQNDLDGDFAVGGFPRAFSFAGGRFIVSPAGRPTSTFSHETGHMFWARDEYSGGGSYIDTRGYYNTQNYNAANNPVFLGPNPTEDRQPSIMDKGACEEGGGLLCDAFQNHTSSETSFAMIGWQDSDGDGIFDVLDVPLALEGVGSYDATQGEYHFVGSSTVQTLPNLNSSVGQPQNDSTINHVSQAQYRINGGPWQEVQRYDAFTANLDLMIPVAAGQQIEIQTIDDVTGITSPTFVGTTVQPAATLMPGINGFVWNDENQDGSWDQGESALANRTVRLIDQNGDLLVLAKGVEPDAYPNPSTLLNNVIPEVTLRSIGIGTLDESVVSIPSPGSASTGSRVFANFCGGFCTEWTNESRQLRMDFTDPVTTVSIDAIARNANDVGRLEIYDANDNLLARYTTGKLPAGQIETMTLSRATADIAYAIAGAHTDRTILLDNLRFGPQASAVTDTRGVYRLPYLEPGTYFVQLKPTAGDQPTLPASGQLTIVLGAGQAVGEVDFGVSTTGNRWQNPTNRFDVNNDGFVTPNDVLLVINSLNANGPQTLTNEPTPPYLDVNGDGLVTANDALQVINAINSNSNSEGEGGASFASLMPSPVTPVAEAEASPRLAGAGNTSVPMDIPFTGDPSGQTMVPGVADLAVSQRQHFGWRFVADVNHRSTDVIAIRQADTRSAQMLEAHDQIIQRMVEDDESLLATELDDQLVDELAASLLRLS